MAVKKYIPYGKQSIDQKDVEAVVETLQSNFVTQGPKVDEFEKNIADYVGAKYAVAVSNGTTALHLMYKAAGIGEGDEIITTPNTFVATSNAALYLGAKPVFVDIRKDTYNIDENAIEAAITNKTKAIVPVHFGGHPCEMDIIWKLAQKHGLKVIEDAAHAIGAEYRGKKIGRGDSDMAMFSFHPVKIITTAEGGIITTNNESYYQKLRSLRTHGVTKNKKGMIEMRELGFNYRITDIQCALGCSQLKKIEEFIQKRHQIVDWYKEEFKEIEGLQLPIEEGHMRSSWHLYVVRLENEAERDALYKNLQEEQIGANYHYPPVYKHPYYQEIGYKGVSCPVSEEYIKTCLTLPLYPDLTREEVHRVAHVIQSHLNS